MNVILILWALVLFVQFVFGFEPFFQRVSTASRSVLVMESARAPLDFIQPVPGVLLRGRRFTALGRSIVIP